MLGVTASLAQRQLGKMLGRVAVKIASPEEETRIVVADGADSRSTASSRFEFTVWFLFFWRAIFLLTRGKRKIAAAGRERCDLLGTEEMCKEQMNVAITEGGTLIERR